MISYTLVYSPKDRPDDRVCRRGVLRDYPPHRKHLVDEVISAIAHQDWKQSGEEWSMDDIILHSYDSEELEE